MNAAHHHLRDRQSQSDDGESDAHRLPRDHRTPRDDGGPDAAHHRHQPQHDAESNGPHNRHYRQSGGYGCGAPDASRHRRRYCRQFLWKQMDRHQAKRVPQTAACSWTCSSRDAPAAPVPRTTRRPPRRRRVGCDASAFGSEAPEACDSVLDTVELSVSSPTKPSRFSVGTMLLAARCIATPSRPVRSSHTMLSPWPRKSFAPRKGNFVSSLSCERRTPALTLSRSREP